MNDSRQRWRRFLADIAVYGIAFGVTNVISYLYVVAAGRTLKDDEFGVFNAILGLITLAGMVATSVQIAVTEATVRQSSRAGVAAFMRLTLRCALPLTLLVTVAAMPFASIIGAHA